MVVTALPGLLYSLDEKVLRTHGQQVPGTERIRLSLLNMM